MTVVSVNSFGVNGLSVKMASAQLASILSRGDELIRRHFIDNTVKSNILFHERTSICSYKCSRVEDFEALSVEWTSYQSENIYINKLLNILSVIWAANTKFLVRRAFLSVLIE